MRNSGLGFGIGGDTGMADGDGASAAFLPHPGFHNFLYANPELYELVYDGSGHAVPRMCERLFAEHLGRSPSSLLDVGCGTGRDLEHFASVVPDCVGVDAQERMIALARSRRPAVDFRVADMRSFRLGRAFDAITCLGLVMSYLHGNDDVDRVLETFAGHARPGTLLVLEIVNAMAAVEGSRLPTAFAFRSNGVAGTAQATYSIDRRRQLLTRRRTWEAPGGPEAPEAPGDEVRQDFVQFRMLFPMELHRYLTAHGFSPIGTYDNTELGDSDLEGPYLYVVARYTGSAAQEDRP